MIIDVFLCSIFESCCSFTRQLDVDGEWSHHKSIPVDDFHLPVEDVASDHPERISSVEPGGVQPEMGKTSKGPIRVGGVR